MLSAAALVALTYVLPLAAVALAGIPAEQFSTGAWADAARHGGCVGPVRLRSCVVLGGTINGVGMFNALMMSYTRLPYALAEEGLLPKVLARRTRAGVPWVSVLLCAVAWALALRISFERLISIDLVLYGAALLLEFVALLVLRVREPGLLRPFRVPGGMGVRSRRVWGRRLLIGFALWAARGERVAGHAGARVCAALSQWRAAGLSVGWSGKLRPAGNARATSETLSASGHLRGEYLRYLCGTGFGLRVRLVVDEALLRFSDLGARERGVAPAFTSTRLPSRSL